MLTDATIYSTALSILTAIITGGFVLIYVELSNKRTRENDKYEQIMRPFMHKLSAYFRYVVWNSSKIEYPSDNNNFQAHGGEKDFKRTIDELSILGNKVIMSGGDYTTNYFTPQQLQEICKNRICYLWYLIDNEHSCNLGWRNNVKFLDENIYKELAEIFPKYNLMPISFNTFIKVSGEFYTDIYQPIQYEPDYHDSKIWLYNIHSKFVTYAALGDLVLLCLMLFFNLPPLFIQIFTLLIVLALLCSLWMMGTSEGKQIGLYNKLSRIKDKYKRK